MTEKEILELILPGLNGSSSLEIPPGDDCAVMKIPMAGTEGNNRAILKVDTIVESIHFNPDDDAERVGHKALARPLSDFAAMGARPAAALVSLSLASPADGNWITGFYRGLNRLAEKFGVCVAGGETTRAMEGKSISVSIVGFCGDGGYVSRHGCQEGDALFVSGELGGSIQGHHLDFMPRIEEAAWLRENFPIHAMMDLSDGLGSDLRSMLDPLDMGADLLRSGIPVSRAARARAREGLTSKSPVEAALTDGEDYELLFAVAPSMAVKVKDAWKAAFPEVPIACIGKVSPNKGIRIQTEKGFELLRQKGFEHFATPEQNGTASGTATNTPDSDPSRQ